MCCMLTVLVFRPVFLGLGRFDQFTPVYVSAAFDHWLLTLLAWFFIPWTVLMHLIVYPGGIVGFDWVWLILGIVADVASYSGGFYGNREQVPGYTE